MVGLPTEERKELLKKCPVPGNCKDIRAPVLTQNIRWALSEVVVTGDNRLIAKQVKPAACLSALGKAARFLMGDNPVDKLEILRMVSDARRILQRENSITRESLILGNVHPSIKHAWADW